MTLAGAARRTRRWGRQPAEVAPPTDRTELVSAFQRGRVLVVGDAILDEWIIGSASAVAREAPVPTIDVGRRQRCPGGAANTAANIAALRGRVEFLGVLGTDEAGDILLGELEEAGVDVSACLSLPGRATRAKRRLVAGQQVLARFDEGSRDPLPAAASREFADRVRELARGVDVIVAADYGGGACTPMVRSAIGRAGRDLPLLVDAHDLSAWRGEQPALVTPNWQEVGHLLGEPPRPPDRAAWLAGQGAQLRTRTGAHTVVATLDCDGAVTLGPSGTRHYPTRPAATVHPSGAGDTLAGVLALATAVGAPITLAVEAAVAAASVVAGRPGTATCSPSDLLPATAGGLLTSDQLLAACAAHRRAGRTICLTNGCFDVLHAGHIACLQVAAASADVVVVALNDDAGTRMVKGPGRPVNPLADRAAILAALGMVHHLVAFSEPSPLGLIKSLRPEVYVKGADHDVDRLPEAQLVRAQGGRVVAAPQLAEHSTTSLIAACASAAGSRA